MKKTYENLNPFVKAEIGLNVLVILAFAIMAPVIVKIKGITFGVTLLGVLALVDRFSIVLSYLVKNIPMGIKHKLMISFITLHLMVLLTYGRVSDEMFIWALTIASLLVNVVMSAFYIDYDAIIADIMPKFEFRDLQYIERVAFSIAGVIGSAIAIVLGDLDNSYIIQVGLVFLAASLVLSIIQHKQYYNGITLEDYKKALKI